MLDPKVGDTFTIAHDFGVQPGQVPAGSQVEVTAVTDAGTPGVGGGDGDDRLILKYDHTTTVLDEDGRPTEGTSSRYLALTVAELTTLVGDDDGIG